MKKNKIRYFACDFETTVYNNQEYTEVWASAAIELKEDAEPVVFNSIEKQWQYFLDLNSDIVGYYHNLKFDGSFWVNWLFNQGFSVAYDINEDDINNTVAISKDKMPNNTFRQIISNFGQWYSITIKVNDHFIEFRDSLKLFPFTLAEVGEAFKTKHRKLNIEYEGYRQANGIITKEEEEYIKNDVYVLQEALMYMFNEGYTRLTIGACCIDEYKRIIGGAEYKETFHDLTEFEIPDAFKGKLWYDYIKTADDYIRKTYRGGWCYVVKGKEGKIFKNGITLDVNSLYPFVMSGYANYKYPVGSPTFWKGNFIPEWITDDEYYFIRIKCRFEIKDNYLPFIQIKDSFLFKPNTMLENSNFHDFKTGKEITEYIDKNGVKQKPFVILYLTEIDFKRFLEFYNVYDLEILDGCYFSTQKGGGLFDCYIKRYKKIKEESKGARRTIAKLFLNNLYGKLATGTNSSYKIPYLKEDGSNGYITVIENNKKAGSIAVASAITSYARDYTIRAAQANYYGKDKAGFIYADTDSIHCDLPLDKIKNVRCHDTDFGAWKAEGEWDIAKFLRQKTYCEHIIKVNGKEVEPYYDFKCAGMGKRCKELLRMSLENKIEGDLTEKEREFLSIPRTIDDFKFGLKIPSKLVPKNIKGGIILAETTFEIINNI